MVYKEVLDELAAIRRQLEELNQAVQVLGKRVEALHSMLISEGDGDVRQSFDFVCDDENDLPRLNFKGLFVPDPNR